MSILDNGIFNYAKASMQLDDLRNLPDFLFGPNV